MVMVGSKCLLNNLEEEFILRNINFKEFKIDIQRQKFW
jgi:hypothetical protein